MLHDKRSHGNEKPLHCNWRVAHCNYRKPAHDNKDLVQQKKKKSRSDTTNMVK